MDLVVVSLNLHTGLLHISFFFRYVCTMVPSDGAVFSLDILVPQTLAIPSERHKAEH